MRFSSELNLDIAPEKAFDAWWDPKAPKYDAYLKMHQLSDTVTNRLKWILKHTLGCPNTFEFHRQELQELNGGEKVSDEQVTLSIQQGVDKEDGFYTEYLKRGQLAVRLDNTLFVHGAADERGLGFVPNLDLKFVWNQPEEVVGEHYEHLDEWIEKLNAFKEESLAQWRQQLRWDETGTIRGGDALMAYQNKRAIQCKTVCVHAYVDGKNIGEEDAYTPGNKSGIRSGYELRSNPHSEKAASYMRKAGISRVIVGHTPSGRAPAILVEKNGVDIVSADTNYAESDGSRGNNWCEVLVDKEAVQIHGVALEREYDCVMEAPIGNLVEVDGEMWWVKVKFDNGEFLISRGRGRNGTDKITKLN
jgi:hypothetical protein